jgi:tetratricopeptide (TPR) repeat protein
MRPSVLQALVFATISAAGLTRADVVELAGQTPFHAVRVIDCRGERLVFRGVSEQVLRVPLARVQLLEITGQTSFNAAEAAARRGDWPAAARDYQHALADAPPPWLAELVRWRMQRTCQASGAFDQAVSLYLDALVSSPALAARFAPRQAGPAGSEVNARARDALAAALETDLPPGSRTAARTLLLELSILDDVQPLPPSVSPPAPSSRAASQPAPRPLGLLPASGDSAEAGSDAPMDRPPALMSDSLLLRAAGEACDADRADAGLRWVERALPFVDARERANWRLILGRCRIATNRLAEALADLRPLAENDPRSMIAAEALYYVAVAYERLGERAAATRAYGEVVQRTVAPPDLVAQSQAALARLSPQRDPE